MALEQLANNAASTLSVAIAGAGDASCTVANGTVFPAVGNFRVLIDSEIILVTARSGNVLTITRGQEGTTAVAHLINAPVTHVLTKGGLDQYIKENALALVPAARVFHTTNQSITSGVTTALAFNSERFDTDTIHDTATNNSRLTCKTAGKYMISGTFEMAASGAGTLRQFRIVLNAATIIGIHTTFPNAGQAAQITVSALYDLAVNDFVETIVLQDSGGALNVTAQSNWSPEFGMVRVA